MIKDSVTVVGAGIAGLTAAAVLAKEGAQVTLIEAHSQPGGCAGTFQRGPFVFDVGATQVAGFEQGGIHQRIFNYLQVPLPKAEILDPGCVVDLVDGYEPIKLWHDPRKWADETKKHFPNSQLFWQLCSVLHKINWAFSLRNPVLPARNAWDYLHLIKAIRPELVFSGLLSQLCITDLLKLCGCHKDKRLRDFLDLQLKLYSQQPADRTAALYGATVLQMAQAPLGLWHLQGSMQKLSDHLISALRVENVQLLLSHQVTGLEVEKFGNSWKILVRNRTGKQLQLFSSDVVFTLPPQCLPKLIVNRSGDFDEYFDSLKKLPKPSGALVFYGVVDRTVLPHECPSHIQIAAKEPGSLFVSISREDDGRAPAGKATVIASVFTETSLWNGIPEMLYKERKAKTLLKICGILENWFGLTSNHWLHQELATPKSFAKWTLRPQGIVGGLGQHPSQFGPYGLPSRTPIKGLWLCGDSIYPGEGTAGVSMSALMVCRQLMALKGLEFVLPF